MIWECTGVPVLAIAGKLGVSLYWKLREPVSLLPHMQGSSGISAVDLHLSSK